MENKIKKIHTYKDLIISTLIIIAGIALFFLNRTIGIILIIVGLFFLFCYKTGYKYDNEKVILQKKSKEISKKNLPGILEFLQGERTIIKIIPGNEGGSLLLEMWYNHHEQVAYAQLSIFQEQEYQKITELIQLQTTNAQILLEQL